MMGVSCHPLSRMSGDALRWMISFMTDDKPDAVFRSAKDVDTIPGWHVVWSGLQIRTLRRSSRGNTALTGEFWRL